MKSLVPNGDVEPTIVCSRLGATLTNRGCAANIDRALTALDMIEDGVAPSSLEEPDLDRLCACGPCLELEMGDVKEAIREDVQSQMERIESMNWERFDDEVSAIRRREKWRRYRDAHREETSLKRRIERLMS